MSKVSCSWNDFEFPLTSSETISLVFPFAFVLMASIRIRHLPQFLGLASCLAALCVSAGCTMGVLEKGPDSGGVWICDDEADKAMRLHDYEMAIALHQRLLKRDPENALALYHLGYAYGQMGNHVEEVIYYKRAIDLGFDKDGIFFNLGMAYGELNELEESMDAFKRALDIDPHNADNHYGLARAYQVAAYDKLAEEEFLKAIEIDPKHIEARLYLSGVYIDRGDLRRAAKQLREILAIDPTDRRARQALESIEME